ncbi:unnamed protein product [Cylindrotheca closterium]|uniref:ESF1 RRM domain-containing protein n=1 Tax=Cylindrotheca closterium TaxID=2856 RepID=A0AAD2GBR3_9STRA|nr:unnamed protein product [Cylindrotheca closterium]
MGGSSKKKRSKKQQDDGNDDDQEITESRFAAASTHPQFRPLKQTESKVVLDDRFSSVLTDPRFQLEGRDKYGRKGKKSKAKTSVKEELSSFYMVEEKEDETTKEQAKTNKSKKEPQPEDSSSSDDDDDDSGSDSSDSDYDDGKKNKNDSKENKAEKKEDAASRIAYLTALSRGEIDESSSSDDDGSSQSSDDDDGEEDEGEDPVYGNAGILDPSTQQEQDEEIEISYDSSPFLVVQNMDWEHIRAVDLFSLLNSFTTMGAVKRVQVFQSDFGKERMEKERLEGPSGIWKKGTNNNNNKAQPLKKFVEEDSDNESSASSKENGDDNSVSSSQENDSDDDEEESVQQQPVGDNDFDPEKLRAYEASKLKYYFAIVEFTSAEYADVAYREVDGMEFERSSSAIDLRTLPKEAYEEVTQGRKMRDEATSIPGNYEPPEFVVNALQQTSVECTWDQGDVEREHKLTQYSSGGWQNMTETDDLQAYLASDASSDDDSDDEKAQKGSAMRKLLGLDSGSEEDGSGDSSSDDSDSEEEKDVEASMSKEIRYIPGQKDLEEKIRSKLKGESEPKEELTPWEKYQEKRKQKRRERRQAARGRKNEPEGRKSGPESDDGDESVQLGAGDNDDFFVESDDDNKPKKTKKKNSKSKQGKRQDQETSKAQSANTAELELLLAGDNDEEQEKDFDIRGIQRIEKNKGKKLKGGRKRKEEKITKDVSGTNFKVDVEDNRFAAVLNGADGKFGIDKTDPNYKDTAAMRDILTEQTKRRKKKRQKTKASTESAPNVNADSNAKTSGSNALSSLVQRLKTKVANQ